MSESNNNSIPQSNRIAIRVSDYKRDVMYQTQTAGIEFVPCHKELVTHCPKCGHQNTAIYFDAEYIRKRPAFVHCCECRIPYPVEIPEEVNAKNC